MKKDMILVIGADGQLGTGLTASLRHEYGAASVIAPAKADIPDTGKLSRIVKNCGITQIYLLESTPDQNHEQSVNSSWNSHIKSLVAVLDMVRDHKLIKVFWPSSIDVFGPGTPKHNCPQDNDLAPVTSDGILKRCGEYWCRYYCEKYGVDVRSLRLPGLITYSASGKCISTYAADSFHHALENCLYTCYLSEDACLPMLYLPDAIRAILELMNAPSENIAVRTSYNITGSSFSPCDLANSIQQYIPGFTMNYEPDARQVIANAWPVSINDIPAQQDWGWQPHYNLRRMTIDALQKIAAIKNLSFYISPDSGNFCPDYPHNEYAN